MTASTAIFQDSGDVAEEPVADLLSRVGCELALVAEALDNVEVPIHDALLHGAGSRYPPFIQVMQDLDHMRQTVACLGEFLCTLAASSPDHWRLDPKDAAAVVTLADLAKRLRANGEMANWGKDGGGNDCELF